MRYERKIKTFGFINVDKPSGVTSSTVVNKIKRLTGQPCGHMGTLDPMASGVLPVAVGNATRLFDYFLKKRKIYLAEFLFGADSDTLDTTGEVTVLGSVPSEKEIEEVIPSLLGEVMQIPPKYSAKNVGGKRGYELARAGVSFELEPKQVEIYSIRLLGKGERENSYRFKIECGAGTYIRSIARDMAAALNTFGIMSGLKRTKSGIFEIANAVPMDELTEENIENYILPTPDVLPFERLDKQENSPLFNGMTEKTELKDGEYKLYKGGEFYGIAEVKQCRLKAKTKLC